MWLWAALWLGITNYFGLFLLKLWILLGEPLQGHTPSQDERNRRSKDISRQNSFDNYWSRKKLVQKIVCRDYPVRAWLSLKRQQRMHKTAQQCVLLGYYNSVNFPWWFDRKNIREMCRFPEIIYRKVASSRLVHYSILELYGQRSQYIYAFKHQISPS